MRGYYTEETNFFGNTNPKQLLEKYGSPLYVYNENILRQRCREMKSLISYPRFRVCYSTKANSNVHLLKIIHQEGLHADAISPGEIVFLEKAGFKPQEIFFITNNASSQEMEFAIERGITVSVDSISQLKLYGSLNPGGKVAIRINPGIGAGHSEKVITAGNNTKFGIYPELIPEVKRILKEYDLKLVGINQHIGSLFMDPTPYVEAAKTLLSIAENFNELEFIDFGGGFGIPYRKQEGQDRLDLKALGQKLDEIIHGWTTKHGIYPTFQIEPGRYIVAECSVLLGTVYAVKQGYNTTYVGTDLGFNVLIRPAMYNSHHDVEVYDENGHPVKSGEYQDTTVVGNICESGDIIAKNRLLPPIREGYILVVTDAGAYGYSMASNYNNRLRPAEVLIDKNGNDVLIRRRDTFEDLLSTFNF
ncbi:diaminopimelate decarboxylase [Caldicoprobacter guelmensis]|uniref:diaminopimelate decarboxylase n=1 Tax=Caldicoprobacter guelmensis TaxID=1170224 RepID=UPI00195DE505|nr:diaminopimelate decarboxylase [Caldicoprobacter guelmensis]MBM7581804.1 diaminopimelate decarboxylase [Caldicoprobacter guelmensis]